MTQLRSQVEGNETDVIPDAASPQFRTRHLATVTLRLLMVTALASFWLVAGVGVIGLLR